jgi:hypothetical protein
MSNGSWRVDETYVNVKGRWTYLYRAVDSRGQTIDFLLSTKRDAEAAKRFFRKALARLLDSPTNAGRLRGNGHDQERAGSKHCWQRYQGPDNFHRQAVRRRRVEAN